HCELVVTGKVECFCGVLIGPEPEELVVAAQVNLRTEQTRPGAEAEVLGTLGCTLSGKRGEPGDRQAAAGLQGLNTACVGVDRGDKLFARWHRLKDLRRLDIAFALA